MNFYTGITSISNFEEIYEALWPQIHLITLWRGPKKVISQAVRPKKIATNRPRKLTPKNELLLTLLRLRFVLLGTVHKIRKTFGTSSIRSLSYNLVCSPYGLMIFTH